MGFEGQFTESFAGWSHEVRPAQSAVQPDEELPERQSSGRLIPNIVKYRLLPGTAVVAIALTVPGFSQGAGEPAGPPFAAPDPVAFAEPARIADTARPTSALISQDPVASASQPAAVLLAPLVEVPLAEAALQTALVTLPSVPAVSVEPVGAGVSETSFAEAFETFDVSADTAGKSTPEVSALPAEVISVALPDVMVVPVGAAGGAIEQASPASVASASAPARQLVKVDLPISALSTGRIPEAELDSISAEHVALPLVSAAPVPLTLASSGTGTTERIESKPNGVATSSDFVIMSAPAQAASSPGTVAAVPVVPAPAPTRSAAVAPQISALPPTRASGTRNDAMPIVVERPQAVAPPVAKAPLPSAKSGFASAVDPRRPASLPVSGSVSGLDLNIQSQLVTRIDGQVAGELDFQQTNNALAVRLGSIVELLRDRYDMSEFERITASSASDMFVSMGQLRDAGIPITYDPVYDEFNVGTRDHRPSAAHKVQIDQIGSPHRSTERSGIDQIQP
ncbi:MAG: hypothetical protein AAGE86_04820 [Pseudomonadota bacterium]